jgi:3-mercaptopyruvate sulfurtransferase SseA
MVPDGADDGRLFNKYNIDPQNDMVVCAQGTGSTGNAMAQGRCWYALRYWGMDSKNLAVLNGGNQWINGNGMAPPISPPPPARRQAPGAPA